MKNSTHRGRGDWPIAVMAVNLALCTALLLAVVFDHPVPARREEHIPTLRVECLEEARTEEKDLSGGHVIKN